MWASLTNQKQFTVEAGKSFKTHIHTSSISSKSVSLIDPLSLELTLNSTLFIPSIAEVLIQVTIISLPVLFH